MSLVVCSCLHAHTAPFDSLTQFGKPDDEGAAFRHFPKRDRSCSDTAVGRPQAGCNNIIVMNRKMLTFSVTKSVYHLHRFHLKGSAAVFTEHGADCVQHNLGLGEISCCDLYEHILCV